ncbi:MAG: hypothetical protein CMO98_00800 [Woeseia sp.]|nr:hypothetical protein [Woeseia sp.]
MKTFKILFIFLSMFHFFWSSASYARDSFTIDDALRMKNVGDVTILPDGTSVFYSISSLDWSKNERTKRYFLTSADGLSTREYIGSSGGESFSFSPDGKYLAFLRVVESDRDSDEPKMQIFTMPTDGGEAVQISNHPGRINNYQWSQDVETIFFVAEEVYDEETEREIKLGADPIFVDEAPNGKGRARFSNIWELDLLDGKDARKITNENLIIDEFALGPDNATIVFVARPDDRTNYGHLAELYIHKDDKLERITSNEAPESLPLISPDASTLAYRAPSDEDFELRSGYFWVMDLETREKQRLDGQKTGEVFGAISWSSDSTSLIYNEQHGVNTNLYEINIVDGVAKALTNKTGIYRAQAFSKDSKTVAYISENHTSPKDLYVSDLSLSEPVRLTDANPWIRRDRALTQGETLQWKGKGGMLIEGIYYPPVRKGRSSGKDPLIVFIHGGPAAAWEANFREDFQIITNAGYAILAPNPRGSQGYGEKFLQALRGEVGDGEYIDMMNGLDYVIANKNVDPDRLGISGWSWGGVATSYTITQTERFKAASIGAMVGNWAAETGPGFNFDVALWYIGGTPWNNPEEWAKRSAITHVKNVTTPSIIFHGGEDTTSSVGQSLMFFTALRDIGKAPARYIKFPRQGHGVEEPRLLRILYSNELQWFKKHIDGVDWEIPPASFEVQ